MEEENTGVENEAAAPLEESNLEQQSEQPQGEQVPLSALQSERAERQRLQEEVKLIKDHLSLMQSSNKEAEPSKKTQEWDGLTDDDVLTVGEAKKYLNQMNSSYSMSIKELKMMQKHPDYQDVIHKHLPEVLKQNPGLRKTLETTQDFELAYYLAKQSDGYKGETKQTKKSKEAEKILQNAQQTGGLSSVGASTPVGMAKNYSKMSDKEFKNLMNRNLGYS